MRPSRHVLRSLVTVVTLLLAALVAVDAASAQVGSEGVRAAASAGASAATSADHSGTAEDDCPSRRIVRGPAGAPARSLPPGHVCGCYFRTGVALRAGSAVTVRAHGPRTRSVDLPLLHQVFRC